MDVEGQLTLRQFARIIVDELPGAGNRGNAYLDLPQVDQDAIIEFLEALQVVPPRGFVDGAVETSDEDFDNTAGQTAGAASYVILRNKRFGAQ